MKHILGALPVIAICVLGVGCASDGVVDECGANTPRQEVPVMEMLSGRLKSGYVGIGGEHTGWVMLVPGRDAGEREEQVEVDVSKVPAAAKVNDGTPVTAHGAFVEKRYVERGVTKIFVIERFQTCYEPGT